MSEDNGNGEGEGEGQKKAKRKTMEVNVLHAVDAYHFRNKIITVPDDAYHQGLVRAGHLQKVEG